MPFQCEYSDNKKRAAIKSPLCLLPNCAWVRVSNTMRSLSVYGVHRRIWRWLTAVTTAIKHPKLKSREKQVRYVFSVNQSYHLHPFFFFFFLLLLLLLLFLSNFATLSSCSTLPTPPHHFLSWLRGGRQGWMTEEIESSLSLLCSGSDPCVFYYACLLLLHVPT